MASLWRQFERLRRIVVAHRAISGTGCLGMNLQQPAARTGSFVRRQTTVVIAARVDVLTVVVARLLEGMTAVVVALHRADVMTADDEMTAVGAEVTKVTDGRIRYVCAQS